MRTPIAALVAIAIAFCAFAVEAAPLDAYARIPLVEAATLSPRTGCLHLTAACPDHAPTSVTWRDANCAGAGRAHLGDHAGAMP